jgi:acyl carrier protein
MGTQNDLESRPATGTDADVKLRVRRYIADTILMTGELAVGDDESLLERRILDSLAVLDLTEYLQTEYGIKIESDELLPENLDSLNRIAAFVERKRRGGGATP